MTETEPTKRELPPGTPPVPFSIEDALKEIHKNDQALAEAEKPKEEHGGS